MAESARRYKFDDPEAAFAEAKRRIRHPFKAGVKWSRGRLETLAIRMNHWLFCVILFCCLSCAANDCLFEIQDFRFCKDVVTNTPARIVTKEARLKRGESLYLWTRVRVYEEGVKMLKSSGRLYMKHAWSCDSVLQFEVNHIGISREKWAQDSKRYLSQYASQGYFEYRTWSRVRIDLQSGKWRVHIYDVENRTPDFDRHPCVPTISVQMVK